MENEYPKEFQHLLDWCTAQPEKDYYNYVGWGNSEAEILFIGAEPSKRKGDMDQETVNKEKYDCNLEKWTSHTQCSDDWYAPGRCNWKGLWSHYQKITEHLGMKGNFLLHSFNTDISHVRGFPKDINHCEKRKSIQARIKMFQQEYFQRFRLVIVAAKNDTWNFYEKDGRNYCKDAFNTQGGTETLLTSNRKVWIYQRQTYYGTQYIIHCHQLGALFTWGRKEVKSKFIKLVKDLMKK